MTLSELNIMERAAFVAALGDVFEHSPWVAEGVAMKRPFASIDALHEAIVHVVSNAGVTTQLALIRAHPELAGKASVRGELTADSSRGQSGTGLTQCSSEEFAQFQRLNDAYNTKFGFPFIIAVKGFDRNAIVARFAERVGRDYETEFAEALTQIARIARLRLETMVGV